MKYKMFGIALFAAIACHPIHAADIMASALTSNFAFNSSGIFSPSKPRFGTEISVRDQLLNNLDGVIAFESSPINGNLLSARASWSTSLLEISAGPSFGVLNSSGSSTDIPVLFQPGLGIGFAVSLPGLIIAEADTDFALPPASESAGQVYLQKSRLAAGFFLPNILCTVAVKQENNALSSATETRIKSLTDYGLYTEAYKKGSPFRISINFIYRVADFYAGKDAIANKKIGNLILGGGFTWAPKSDFNLFVSGNGALYSFSLGESVKDLDKFLFDVKAGVWIRTKSFTLPR